MTPDPLRNHREEDYRDAFDLGLDMPTWGWLGIIAAILLIDIIERLYYRSGCAC